jgi:eukaryotic-like serine/threonine-protein kinase
LQQAGFLPGERRVALLNEQIEGKYEILGKLREGGMGAVYKVRHRLLDEVRVVKVVRPHAEGKTAASERFLHEAKVAIRLRHPNVAILHDFAVDEDGTAFIVMEFIDGWSLLDVLQGYGPPPLPLCLEIARQALRALAYLHRQGIVHRDISPDNLMLCQDGEGNPLVKLIDLGIAKAVGASGGLTTTGVFLGKPRYASPEQFEGRGIGPQSDLYSFAVVLYELLTGRCPVHGQDAPSFMAGHLLRPPLDFDEVDPKGAVPADLRRVVLQALAKKPPERMAGAEEFARAIAQVQGRHPLTRRDFEAVLDVLLPLGAKGTGPAAPPAGSTQIRLDWEFGAVPTPPPDLRSVLAAVPPLPTTEEPYRPVASGSPAGAPTRKTAEPLRSVPTAAGDVPLRRETPPAAAWAGREIHRTLAPEPARAPTRAEVESAAPARPQGPSRAVLAGAAVALALVAGGVGWLLSSGSGRAAAPAPAATGTPAAVTAPVAAATVSPPPPSQPQRAVPARTEPAATAPPAEPPALVPTAPPPSRSRSASSRPAASSPPAAPAPPLKPMQKGDFILHGGPGISEPVPLSLPRYDYPTAARGSGRRASVRVGVLIDEDGKVLEAALRERDSSGLGFNEAALEAARKTRFQAGTRDEIPGKMWTELIFEFAE